MLLISLPATAIGDRPSPAPQPTLLPPELLASFPATTYALPFGVSVGDLDGFRFFVMPARSNQVCLMGLRGSGVNAETFGGCTPLIALSVGPVWRARRLGTAVDLIGLVSNGYTRLQIGERAFPVRNNVFLVRTTVRARLAVLSGAGQIERTLQFRWLGAPGSAAHGRRHKR